jgi:hypothetical protein
MSHNTWTPSGGVCWIVFGTNVGLIEIWDDHPNTIVPSLKMVMNSTCRVQHYSITWSFVWIIICFIQLLEASNASPFKYWRKNAHYGLKVKFFCLLAHIQVLKCNLMPTHLKTQFLTNLKPYIFLNEFITNVKLIKESFVTS